MSAQRFAAAAVPESTFGYLFQMGSGQDATVTVCVVNPNDVDGTFSLALVNGSGPSVVATDIFALNQHVTPQNSFFREKVVVPDGFSLWISGSIQNMNVLVYGYADPQ